MSAALRRAAPRCAGAGGWGLRQSARLPLSGAALRSVLFLNLKIHPAFVVFAPPRSRFLQGPGTDKATVKRLRHAIEDGREITVQLLNYTKTGYVPHCACCGARRPSRQAPVPVQCIAAAVAAAAAGQVADTPAPDTCPSVCVSLLCCRRAFWNMLTVAPIKCSEGKPRLLVGVTVSRLGRQQGPGQCWMQFEVPAWPRKGL